jgi:16S rRNA processing protein RimM
MAHDDPLDDAAVSGEANPLSHERGSERNHSEPRFLVIGQVMKPHGVRGEMRVVPHTDLPERFGWLDTVYVGEANPRPFVVEQTRWHKNWILIKLAGCDTRERAAALRGEFLLVPEDQAIPLQENEYFLFQLIGLAVATTAGKELGTLVEVIETGANNVFVVHGPQGEYLLPDIPDVIEQIEFQQGRMIIQPLPGLFNA